MFPKYTYLKSEMQLVTVSYGSEYQFETDCVPVWNRLCKKTGTILKSSRISEKRDVTNQTRTWTLWFLGSPGVRNVQSILYLWKFKLQILLSKREDMIKECSLQLIPGNTSDWSVVLMLSINLLCMEPGKNDLILFFSFDQL